MPQWPIVALALALVLLSAYVIGDLVSRVLESSLRSILPDEQERRFVDRPKRTLRVVIFLVTAVALSLLEPMAVVSLPSLEKVVSRLPVLV